MSDIQMSCEGCFWCFGGVCASHSMTEPDTYGKSCDELTELFPFGCNEFRQNPDFLSEQNASGSRSD